MKILSILFYAVGCFILISCNQAQTEEIIDNDFIPTITITSPSSADTIHSTVDSLSLEWTIDSIVSKDDSYSLYLIQNEIVLKVLSNNLSLSESYSWSPAESFALSNSNNDFQLSISSNTDDRIIGYSGIFVITDMAIGSITISSPDSLTVIDSDTLMTATWNCPKSVGSHLKFDLFRDTFYVHPLGYSSNVGIAESLSIDNKNFETDSSYRIRISSLLDTSLLSFSPYFTIQGTIPNDIYEQNDHYEYASLLTSDSTQYHTTTRYDKDWIKFSPSQENHSLVKITHLKGPQLGIKHFIDSQYTNGILINSNSTSLYDTMYITSPKGASGINHIEVIPHGVGSQYAVELIELDSIPIFNIIYPSSETVLNTQVDDSIVWEPAYYQKELRIQLWEDTSLTQELGIRVENDGFTNYLPRYGLKTSNKYQIKVLTEHNQEVIATSDYFAIKGTDPDTFENDNSFDSAKILPAFHTEVSRTLTRNYSHDKDWLYFPTKRNYTYIFNYDTTSIYTDAFNSDSTPINLKKISDALFYTVNNDDIVLNDDGLIYFKNFSFDFFEAYTLIMKEYHNDSIIDIIEPNSNTIWSTQDSCSVRWNSKSTHDQSISISLLHNEDIVWEKHFSNKPQELKLKLPKDLLTSDRYRIKMNSSYSRAISNISPMFKINGREPDIYENDNTFDNAKPIKVGSDYFQYHTFSYHDTDWVAFNGQKDTIYHFSISDYDNWTISYRIYDSLKQLQFGHSSIDEFFSDKNANSVKYRSGRWQCPEDGTYYIELSPDRDSQKKYVGTSYDFWISQSQFSLYTPEITFPELGDTLVMGNGIDIKLTMGKYNAGHYIYSDAFLLKNGNIVDTIFHYGELFSPIRYYIPDSLEEGTGYSIKVLDTYCPSISDESPTFYIKQKD